MRGLHYLYVIMDYAEQNLGQLLQHRPLSEAEVREMLPMTLEALGFLHSKDLVQGQLKPSNILVIDNQLELASDTIRPAGEATASIGSLSVYNPPEARDGSFSTSGDIWALGVTLCQALTQRPPARSGERGEVVALPTDFPVSFIDIVRRCLARNPAQRPSVADLQAWLKPGSRAPSLAAPAPPGVGNLADTRLPGGKALGAAAADTKVAGTNDSGAHSSGTKDSGTGSPAAKSSGTRSSAANSPATRSPDAATPARLRIRAVLNSEPAAQAAPGRKSAAPPIWGVVAALALVGVGVYWFMSRSNSEAPGAETAATAAPTVAGQPAVTSPSDSSASSSSEPPVPDRAPSNHAAPASADSNSHPLPARAPASRPSATDADTEEGLSPGVLYQEIPDVSSRSRQTIHGRSGCRCA